MARYHARCTHGLGWTMVVLGVLSVGVGTATAVVLTRGWSPDPAAYISAPVWSGLTAVATGVLAVLSGKRPANRCLMIALLAVAIVTVVFCLFCCVLTVVEAHLAERCITAGFPGYTITGYNTTGGHNFTLIEDDPPDCSRAPLPLQVICEVLAFTEALLGFAVSAMCCCVLAGSARGQPVTYVQNQPNGEDGGYVIMQTGQNVPLNAEGREEARDHQIHDQEMPK